MRRLASLVTDCPDGGRRPFVALENVESGTGRLTAGEVDERAAPDAGAAAVEPGSVLFGKLRPYLAKTWLVDRPIYASTELLALRAERGVNNRWLAYLCSSRPVIEWAVATSDGTKMPRTSWEKLGAFRVDLLPLGEQRAIADFLDAQTARIDALIEKKQRLVDVLAARWTGKATSTILRGLDPVGGDGQLPPGWRRPRLGVALQLHRGFDLPQDDRREGVVPVVSSGAASGWHDTAACGPPGVVTGRYGTVGQVHYVDVPYWPLNTTLFVSDFRGNHPRWAYHLLRVLPLNVDEEKSAVTGINRNVVGQLFVPLPPLAVQREIAEALDATEAHHRTVTDRLEHQISLLREHRQALITAAVTGQLDLATVAA
jgi:type I restriction enzyme S subunit